MSPDIKAFIETELQELKNRLSEEEKDSPDYYRTEGEIIALNNVYFLMFLVEEDSK